MGEYQNTMSTQGVNHSDAVPRIRIAIIGAGIGGLTLAASLRLFDRDNKFEVNVYEAAHQIAAVGAGIGVWPRTWKIMTELGFDGPLKDFLSCAPNNDEQIGWTLRKADQPQGVDVREFKMNGSILGFHRADLHRTLLDKICAGSVHIHKRLVSFSEMPEGKVCLIFQDGTNVVTDVLVGMDGIKSVVRKGLLARQGMCRSPSRDPVWTGTVVYRGLIAHETLGTVCPGHRALSMPLTYVGKFKHVVVYPVRHKDGTRLVNVAAFVSDPSNEGTPYNESPSSCTQEELVAAFEKWEPEVKALMQCITRPAKWLVANLIPLESYASGRIFIGGDAAHAMPPHQWSGAGQAIEDAYILAKLLCHPRVTNASIPTISSVYSSIRCPEGTRVLWASIRTGKLYELDLPELEHVKEGNAHVPLEHLDIISESVCRELEWAWKSSAENDVLRALTLMGDSQIYCSD